MANLGPPAPPTRIGETVAITRTTRDGRQLHYEMKVLQQPERARACGSGPKSSADRRPVDPPPVVQMKVFEGPRRETAKDITFMYNADFFLYASLHHDTDNHGNRVNPQNSPPVLTGMPVSSMILLDRPEEAGYFIFSDLSVRHEGRYYLTFALMEEVKNDCDKDPDEQMGGTDEITGPDVGCSGRHFSFRTTVQTDVFDVFSAKKFPGLMESTALSRTVAEQGCRVRIRRDVRMRRREKGGGNKGKEVAAREDQYAQKARVEASPHIRGRSSSNETSGAYQSEAQRRQSGMDYGPPRPSLAAAPEPAKQKLSYAQAPHGHASHYPPHAAPPHTQSLPDSPSYPPPPASVHGAPQYPARAPYPPYHGERPPSRVYGPPAPVPAPAPPPHRNSYSSHRSSGPPALAPRLEVDLDIYKPKNTLPPIRATLDGSVSQPRRPSYPSQLSSGSSLPRLLPQPPPQARDLTPPESSPFYHKIMNSAAPPSLPSLPPIASSYEHPPAPPTPITPSRKRRADEAFTAMPSESYRLQNGRREDEQPRDANYKVDQPSQPQKQQQQQQQQQKQQEPVQTTYHVEQISYRDPALEIDDVWELSQPVYYRATDVRVNVEFPPLYDSGEAA